MTAVDRAFIKAYTSRRLVRGNLADATEQSAAKLGEITLGGSTTSYRVDGPHLASTARAAGPHVKSTLRKPRRPSAEIAENAEHGEQAPASASTAPSSARGVGNVWLFHSPIPPRCPTGSGSASRTRSLPIRPRRPAPRSKLPKQKNHRPRCRRRNHNR